MLAEWDANESVRKCINFKKKQNKETKGKYLEAKRKVKKAASCYNIAYNSEKGT